jgi:hypothetical protein
VTRGEPAVRIQLEGCTFDELLIGRSDAHAIAEQIKAHANLS